MMRTNIILIFSIIISLKSYSQERTNSNLKNKVDENEIVEMVEEDAEFPGGNLKLAKWISKNVKYPESAIKANKEGKVYVSFVVELDGSISNINIERGVCEDLDNETIRLLKLMPKWKPGKNKGKYVRARCRLPINYKL